MPRKPLEQKRNDPDRRRVERRQARRRLRSAAVPVERRAGRDRRRDNRRSALRRAADTFSAKKKIFARARRARS